MRVGLLGVGEVALQHVKQDLVADVEEVGAARGDAVSDPRDGVVVLGWAHGREEDRSYRLEVRVSRLQLAVLVEDSDELAEVGVLPVTTCPFALFEDCVDRLVG